jgi:hypothetical protein
MRAAGHSVKTRPAKIPADRPRRLSRIPDNPLILPRICPECGGNDSPLNGFLDSHDKRTRARAGARPEGRSMSFEFDPQPLELRRVSPQARVYVLLPSLAELLGEPGLGCRAPIVLPGHARPRDGWALFGSVRERGITLH